MTTAITDDKVNDRDGWVFYDGECALCRSWARRSARLLARRGFSLAPLQAPWVRERLRLDAGAPLTKMRLLLTDGRNFGGADAVVEIARRIWWARPIAWLAHVPGMPRLMRNGYAHIAANRHCIGGACRTPIRPRHNAATTFLEMP